MALFDDLAGRDRRQGVLLPAAFEFVEAVDLVDRLQRPYMIGFRAEFDEADELIRSIKLAEVFDHGHALPVEDGLLPAAGITRGGKQPFQRQRRFGLQGVSKIVQVPALFVVRVVQQREALFGPARRSCVGKEFREQNMSQFVWQRRQSALAVLGHQVDAALENPAGLDPDRRAADGLRPALSDGLQIAGARRVQHDFAFGLPLWGAIVAKQLLVHLAAQRLAEPGHFVGSGMIKVRANHKILRFAKPGIGRTKARYCGDCVRRLNNRHGPRRGGGNWFRCDRRQGQEHPHDFFPIAREENG